MKTIARRFRPALFVLSLMAVSLGFVSVASPANAANGAYVSYSRGTSVWLAQTMSNSASGTFVANRRSVDLMCWKDGPTSSLHVNYLTPRWFYVRVWTSIGPIWGWVSASVVINQYTVGYCY